MELKDSEELIESFKKRPRRTVLTVIAFLILLSVIAYFQGFFSEMGKRAIALFKEAPRVAQPSKDLRQEWKKAEPRQTINQHTEGDQAPAVNVAPGGHSTINYGSRKEKAEEE